MRLQNLKISTQLIVGNSLIIFLVLFLTGLAYFQTRAIIRIMDDLYQHPYRVGGATREINTNCALIHSSMKNIVFEDMLSSSDILDLGNEMEILEKKTFDLFDIVYKYYLGDKGHIDSAFNVFSDWKIHRDKLIFLKQHNLETEMISRYREVNQPYVDKLLRNVGIMVDFAGNKGRTLYDQAMSHSHTLLIRIVIVVCIITLLIILINYSFIKRINEPLKGLTSAAEQYTIGHYENDYIFESENELGMLSRAFRKMASTFRKDIKLKETTAELAFALQSESDLNSFSKILLEKLACTTNSQVAALYLPDNNEKVFRPFHSVGMDADKLKTFSSEIYEGEFGMVLSSKKIQVIRNIPDDTVFVFSTVSGTFRIREIITIPFLNSANIVCIISLGSVKTFDTLTLQWISEILPILTARINGVMFSQKIRDYSVMVDNQNKTLGLKNTELLQQAEELREYNLELNLQKKQIDQANQLKTSFLSNMSHELRTPLNSVIALSSVLSNKLKNRINEDEYNYVRIIEKNGKELLELINNILDLSRIEAGREVVSNSWLSVNEIVKNITENLLPLVKEKKIKLINLIDPKIPLFISDLEKCKHILQNIIHNAVKFTEKGKVEINAKVNTGKIIVTISDTGIGIAPDKLSIIFDEFRQADERSSRKYGGTGLGLAIARKYSQMLGGDIEVESTLGKGAIFTVTLPLEPLQYSGFLEEKTDTPVENHLSATKDKAILIIEDSEAAIVQIKDFLDEAGYKVLVSNNREMAFKILSATTPDAIILDLMIPGCDGFEILNQIRNLDHDPAIPVLILTAKNLTFEEREILKRNKISQLFYKGAIRKEEILDEINSVVLKRKKKKIVSKTVTNKKRKPSIVIIEDNPDNLLAIKAILRDSYEITEANNGIEGIEKVKFKFPDIVLLDISLPDIDGFTVLDELRKVPGLSGIPIVALTARVLNEDRERFLAYGFDGFVPKPIDPEFLADTIRKFISAER